MLILGTAALVFAKPIFGLLMKPVLDALPPEGRALVYTSGIEEINVLMKVGVYCGIFLTTPVILWQIWGFVSPGLYPEERALRGALRGDGLAGLHGWGRSSATSWCCRSMFKFLLNEEESTALSAAAGRGAAARRTTRCASCGWATRSARGRWPRRRARR